MDCAGGTCTPDTTGNALVVSKNGSGISPNTGGNFNNGTLRNASGMVFSLGDIPSGATITCNPAAALPDGLLRRERAHELPVLVARVGRGLFGHDLGQEVRQRLGIGYDGLRPPTRRSTRPSASRSFSMVGSQGGADYSRQAWKAWTGAGLTGWVQDVAGGVAEPRVGAHSDAELLLVSGRSSRAPSTRIRARRRFSRCSGSPENSVRLNPSPTNIHFRRAGANVDEVRGRLRRLHKRGAR